MSAALLRKSLELVDSSRPSGFTPSSKRSTIPEEIGNQNLSEKGQQKNKQGTAPAITVGNTSSKKNKSKPPKRKADPLTPEDERTAEEIEQERVEENVRRLLLLSARPISETVVADILNRKQKGPQEPKKPKEEEKSAFTDADFDNFQKEFFGHKSAV